MAIGIVMSTAQHSHLQSQHHDSDSEKHHSSLQRMGPRPNEPGDTPRVAVVVAVAVGRNTEGQHLHREQSTPRFDICSPCDPNGREERLRPIELLECRRRNRATPPQALSRQVAPLARWGKRRDPSLLAGCRSSRCALPMAREGLRFRQAVLFCFSNENKKLKNVSIKQ